MVNFRLLPQPMGLLALGTLLTLAACDHRLPPDPALVSDNRVILLNDANQLLQISARNPSTVQRTTNLTGLQAGEQIIGIDFRPATGQLYGLSNQSRIYVVDDSLGICRAVGAPFAPELNRTPSRPESGEGFDFNPAADLIRITTGTRQNLRVDPVTGAVVSVDPDINAVGGVQNINLQGVAYSNNRAGSSTTMYGIDPVTDRLYSLVSPNNGTITGNMGPLGLNISAVGGFDIAPPRTQSDLGQGLAAVTFEGRSELQSVDLQTGKLQKLGDLPGNIIGLAIPTRLVVYSVIAYYSSQDILFDNRLTINDPTGEGGGFSRSITGLQTGESIVGMDFRPATGQLYAVSTASRLFTLNPVTGVATLVGTLSTPLDGTDFGFDFNPVADRIRIVSNTGQNLRVNPTDATVIVDGTLNGATSSITSSAYTNNVAGATSTQLYGINIVTKSLYLQNPPNSGTQALIGPLTNVEYFSLQSRVVGFDIGSRTGTAYILFAAPEFSPGLFRIDLNTGAATTISNKLLGGDGRARAFTVGLGF